MAGSKIKKDKVEYQFSFPQVFPDGSQFSVYTTPKNEAMIIQHSSGSHIEFKSDGSIFIQSVKDLHLHEGTGSLVNSNEFRADNSTNRTDSDKVIEVKGKLKIKCDELDFEISKSGRIFSGTDLIVQSNNTIVKSTEAISIEPRKTLHIDTKEIRQRYLSQLTENATFEDEVSGNSSKGVNKQQTKTVGGARNTLNVSGNFTIRNDDPNGSISIYSKGYINLVAGMERVDVTGLYTETPSVLAKATYTNIVKPPAAGGKGQVGNGNYYEEITTDVILNHSLAGGGYIHNIVNGNFTQNIVNGSRLRNVSGSENVNIKGVQQINAALIFLN